MKTVQLVYLEEDVKALVVSNGELLEEIKIGKEIEVRKDIDKLDVVDGFYIYENMRKVLVNKPKITGFNITPVTGFPVLELDNSGYTFPLTVLESCCDCEAYDAEELYDELYDFESVQIGDKLRLKHNLVVGKNYGRMNNVRYTPHQFQQYLQYYETHPFAMPGELVTVVDKDKHDNTILCKYKGKALWYGLDMLEKPLEPKEEVKKELEDHSSLVDFESFISFVNTLRKQEEQEEQIPQIKVDDDLDVAKEQLDDGWMFEDNDDYDDFDLDFDDDYEDDLLDERYDGNRSPDYEFNFYSALEELKFMEETKQENEIWIMTNGERTFTFRDERLVSVRLADSVENFVYYSATIQLDDLDDTKWNWKLARYVDEETRKLEKLVEIIQTLKDERLALELLDIIQL